MGLDSFKSGGKSEDNEDESQEKGEEDETSSSDVGGLEAFKSENFIEEEKSDEQDSEDEGWTEKVNNRIWESEEEKVRYIRENFVSDFKPDYQPDERWEYHEVNEVTCVCDNTFIFREKGMCLDCGRTYKDVGRTVVKVHEPEDKEHDASK